MSGTPSHRGPFDHGCPIPATHRRLSDVHDLWHEAVDDYFDPDRFRRRLNTLLQETRNVTFVLQGEKRRIPGFDGWYGQWQQRMRGDPIMRWLQDARTHVTKRGDLGALSKARATVLRSWLERARAETDVPPMLPLEAIVAMFTRRLPQELLDEGVLLVERRWVADSLPDHEVLDAVAHCYGVLSSLVKQGHERSGAEYLSAMMGPDGPRHVPTGHLSGRLPCMAFPDRWRRVCIHLGTGDTLSVAQIPATPNYDAARERYGDLVAALPRRDPIEIESADDFLGKFGRWLFDTGKVFLQRDGYHCAVLWMIGPGNAMHLHEIRHEDREQLMLVMENLADQVERCGVWGLASVHESWMAPLDPEHPGRAPSDSPDRREVFCVDVAVADGRVKQYMAPFRRVEGRIEFDEEFIDDRPTAFDLEPFRSVWRKSAYRLGSAVTVPDTARGEAVPRHRRDERCDSRRRSRSSRRGSPTRRPAGRRSGGLAGRGDSSARAARGTTALGSRPGASSSARRAATSAR